MSRLPIAKNKKPHQILKTFFDKKRAKTSSFTLRSFAQKLGVSPAFASRVLSGKQDLPIERLEPIAELLEIDAPNLTLIKKSLIHEYLKPLKLTPSEYAEFFTSKNAPIEEYTEVTIPEKQFNLFDPWYNAALIDYSTCSTFRIDFNWLENQLKVPRHELEKSWNYLIQQGYLKLNEAGKYEKTDKHLRLSSSQSVLSLRRFHKSIINKALEELNLKTEQRHFQRRLITSATMALDPERLEEAKKMIMNFIMELSLFCSKGANCKEVYALSALFLPLSKEDANK